MKIELKRKHPVHFLLLPELLYSPPSPPNDAVIQSADRLPLYVHVFAPGFLPDMTDYGQDVRTYRVNLFISLVGQNPGNSLWRRTHCFSATSEEPLAFGAFDGLLGHIFEFDRVVGVPASIDTSINDHPSQASPRHRALA